MKNTNDGGAAFPMYTDEMPFEGTSGLSIRDYFAAKAMQALQSNLRCVSNKSLLAEDAYCIADAMLAEREKWRQ